MEVTRRAAIPAIALSAVALATLGLARHPRHGVRRALPLSSIPGRVSDGRGRAIVGATVCAFGAPSQRHMASEHRDRARCAVAGTDGRYRIIGLLPGSYDVSASAPRFVPRAGARVSVRQGASASAVNFALELGGALAVGQVRDVDGKAIAGAEVWIRGQGDGHGRAVARSGADGRFTTWSTTGPLSVRVSAPGLVTQRFLAPGSGATIDAILAPGSVIAGRVVEPGSGRPVPGAWVQLSGLREDDPIPSAIADDSGRFWIDRLAPERYEAVAETPHGWGTSTPIRLGLGETIDDVIVEAHPASVVTGTIRNAITGRPCRTGAVWLSDVADDWRAHDGSAVPVQNGDGVVAIEAVFPGAYNVTVACDGFVDRRRLSLVVGDRDMLGRTWEALPIAPQPLSFGSSDELSAAAEDQYLGWDAERPYARGNPVARGQVVDATGKPIAGAVVAAVDDDRFGSNWDDPPRRPRLNRMVVTDERGRFAIGGVSWRMNLLAFRRGGGEKMVERIEGYSVSPRVTIQITPPATIRGTVSATGAAPDEITVLLVDRATRQERCERLFRTRGRWIVDDVVPGRYSVAVSSSEADAARVDDLILLPGQETSGLVLPLVSRQTVTGRVIERDTGRGQPGIPVEVWPLVQVRDHCGFLHIPQAVTDAAGRFRIEGVPVGRVEVIVLAPGPERPLQAEIGLQVADVVAGRPTDVSDLRLRRPRRGPDGDLGFELDSSADLVVWRVRAGGPAAAAGLRVGDRIVSLDGNDIRDTHYFRFWRLASIDAGDHIVFGLERGASVEIVAAPPPEVAPRQ